VAVSCQHAQGHEAASKAAPFFFDHGDDIRLIGGGNALLLKQERPVSSLAITPGRPVQILPPWGTESSEIRQEHWAREGRAQPAVQKEIAKASSRNDEDQPFASARK